MQGQVGEWALSGRRGRDTLSPVELATELTARISSGALLSEYSTNTSSSFRAVFTTKRDWGEGVSTYEWGLGQTCASSWWGGLRASGAGPREESLGTKTLAPDPGTGEPSRLRGALALLHSNPF